MHAWKIMEAKRMHVCCLRADMPGAFRRGDMAKLILRPL